MVIQKDFAEYSEEYKAFVNKFKHHRNTDDCYTPDCVYNAVYDFVSKEYDITNYKIERPFFPGGDYETYDYKENSLVLDNPPFSIISKITKFYCGNNINFFLFAPTLTLFNLIANTKANAIVASADIKYENSAEVNTSFITNLGENKIEVRGDLQDLLTNAQYNRPKKYLPKYDYPANLLTASRLSKISDAGLTFKIPKNKCIFVSKLDNESNIKIFGGAALCTDEYAIRRKELEENASLIQAQRNPIKHILLSDREKTCIKYLDSEN